MVSDVAGYSWRCMDLHAVEPSARFNSCVFFIAKMLRRASEYVVCAVMVSPETMSIV
jgi:hypothetical protein